MFFIEFNVGVVWSFPESRIEEIIRETLIYILARTGFTMSILGGQNKICLSIKRIHGKNY